MVIIKTHQQQYLAGEVIKSLKRISRNVNVKQRIRDERV